MDRSRILERIAHLRKRTVENGCTEEEALAAAAKIAELMARYDLSFSDVEMGAADCVREIVCASDDDPISYCIPAIAYFSDTEVWQVGQDVPVYRTDARGHRVQVGWRRERVYNFFGLPHDVQIAIYIHGICVSAIERAVKRYRLSVALMRRILRDRATADFSVSMASELGTRLRQIKLDQAARTRRETGRDLVVVKHAIVQRDLAKLGLAFTSVSDSHRPRDAAAVWAGRAAAGEVRFDPGLSSSQQPIPRIG
ncbi:DUF7168 domain-containing protein [Oceanibaculum indicum]|nr:DUF2786 domain-containing protein [Oceanibaculum indicum]